MISDIIDFLERANISFKENEPLSRRSSFRVGGLCNLIVFPKSDDEIKRVIQSLNEDGTRYLVIGKGTNILFDDRGFNGVIVSTEKLSGITLNGEVIEAFCGSSLTKISLFAMDHSLSGFEFAYGIPGSLGGAVYMNAGAYGGEMSDVIISSTVFDTESCVFRSLSNADHHFGYRDSVLRHKKLVHISSLLSLSSGDYSLIRDTMENLMNKRKSRQPLEFPSAGSTFKRPEGFFAGALIESAGLKGFSIGGAQVSEKHAGFIINTGNATCKDIISLIEFVKERVLSVHGVELECEVVYVKP